jgi:mannose-6-phosphate isomerase-like protein (cupin superfamily)
MRTHEPEVDSTTKFFDGNIKKLAEANSFFRQVLYTGPYCQLVVMSIPPGEEIGTEVHANTDQILVIVEGNGEAIVDGRHKPAGEHNVVFVTAGTRHNVRNIGTKELKLFTIYAPPEHKEGTVHKTRDEAMQEEAA